jgi:hypothetical protein
MRFPRLPSLLRLACPGSRLRLAALAATVVGGVAPAFCQALQPALTAQAARAAIAQVLATPTFPGGLPLASLLLAGGVSGLAAAVAYALACARSSRVQAPVSFSLLTQPTGGARALEEAEALWPEAPVAAVGRLYQGLLARLGTDYQLQVPAGDTEPEIVQRVAGLQLSGLDDFTRRLVEHWQHARYAGQAPSPAAWASLCASWRRLFPHDAAP